MLLAVDLSGSMSEVDMELGSRPVDRLTAAKAVIADFLDRRAGDRVGLLVFGQRAYMLTPLTLDRDSVRQQLRDSVAGLARLKTRFTITTLSNGNLGLLTNMAKRAALPWDCVLSAEVFRAYKPSPDTYLGVARVFDLEPAQVALVAAHHDDLQAARRCGLRTAYIERPLEFGARQPKDVSPQAGNDLHATSLVDLADQLGC